MKTAVAKTRSQEQGDENTSFNGNALPGLVETHTPPSPRHSLTKRNEIFFFVEQKSTFWSFRSWPRGNSNCFVPSSLVNVPSHIDIALDTQYMMVSCHGFNGIACWTRTPTYTCVLEYSYFVVNDRHNRL